MVHPAIFIRAAHIYRDRQQANIEDASIDPDAELSEFHFGQQPHAFKDIDARAGRKIGVIGAGSAYKIFADPALKHRGTEVYIVDTAEQADIEKRLGRKLDAKREFKVSSMDELPDDIDYVAIMTPPEHHAGDIRKLQAAGIPTMVEKPIVPLGSHLEGAGHLEEKLVNHGKAPLYAMDWEIALATPLMAALDMHPTFESIVAFGNGGKDKEAFRQFDVNNVVNIETTFVEGGTNPLAGKQDRGGWLWDISKGGGGLYDMGVHALNAIAVLGFTPEADKVGEVALGAPNFNGTQGIYQAIGSNSVEENPRTKARRPVAEMYARAHLTAEHEGRSIPVMVECGKGGVENDMRITMTDANGNVLNWEFGPDKSVVTLRDKSGKKRATAESHIDPYTLMFEEATRLFQDEKQRAEKQGPDAYKPTMLYYPEQKATLLAIDAIQKKGRSVPVAETDEVKQLQLIGSNQMSNDNEIQPTIPAEKMTAEATLPEDWREATLVGRVMMPGVGPAVVFVREDGKVIDISNSYATTRDLFEQDDPAAEARRASFNGTEIGTVDEIIGNSATRDPSKPFLLSPADFQANEAAGVTFVESLVERMVEEAAMKESRAQGGLTDEVLDEVRARIRQEVADVVGTQDFSKVKPGSDAAKEILARMSELGMSTIYPQVGLGDEGEIFSKALPVSSVGHGAQAGYSTGVGPWVNPEPEVALFVNSKGTIVGAANGNDVNDRKKEGQSALLLHRAKVKNGSTSIGPFVRLFDEKFGMDDVNNLDVELEVHRADGSLRFKGSNNMAKISRKPEEIVAAASDSERVHPDGFTVMCGTMTVPDKDTDGKTFTHEPGDVTRIGNSKLGYLTNVMLPADQVQGLERGALALARNLAGRGLLLEQEPSTDVSSVQHGHGGGGASRHLYR